MGNNCCSCCPCCAEIEIPSTAPKRLGAIFSDIDGTLLFYTAQLTRCGYEQILETAPPTEEEVLQARIDAALSPREKRQRDAAAAGGSGEGEYSAGNETATAEMAMSGKTSVTNTAQTYSSSSSLPGGKHIVRFRHIETGAVIEAVQVPPLKDGYISLKTLELVSKLRQEHDVNFVPMTGARNSTALARAPFLPFFDFLVAEGGGRIYRNPAAAAEKVQDRNFTAAASSSSSADKHGEGQQQQQLVLDHEWLDRWVDAIGPWRYNETRQEVIKAFSADNGLPPSTVVSSHGQLWDCYRALQDRKRLLDAKVDSVPHLDCNSFISSFLVHLVPHEQYLRKNLAVASQPVVMGLEGERVTVVEEKSDAPAVEQQMHGEVAESSTGEEEAAAAATNPLSTSAASVAAAAVSSPLVGQKLEQEQQQQLLQQQKDQGSTLVLEQKEETTADEIHLKLMVKTHFPSLVVSTNLSKATIGPKGCTKAEALKYICGTPALAVDLHNPVILRAMRSEHNSQRRELTRRHADLSSAQARLEAAADEHEEKRMKIRSLTTNIDELGGSIGDGEAKIEAAKKKYQLQLETENCPSIVAAAARVDQSRAQLRKLKQFWQETDDEEEQPEDVDDENDFNLEPSELPLPLLECVEAMTLILRCADPDQRAEEEEGAEEWSEEEEEEAEEEDGAAEQNHQPASTCDDADGDATASIAPATNEGTSKKRTTKRKRRWRGTLAAFFALVRAEDIIDEICQSFSPFEAASTQRSRDAIRQLVDSARVFVPTADELEHESLDEEERQRREEHRRMLRPSWETEEEQEEEAKNNNNSKEEFSIAMIAPLVSWCRAVAAFCAARDKLQPRFDKIRDKERDVKKMRRSKAKLEQERDPLQQRVEELAAEIARLRAAIRDLELAESESRLNIEELEECLLATQETAQSSRSTDRAAELRQMREQQGRRHPKMPRFSAALFDDHNDLGFARLCEIGFAVGLSHPAVEEFLAANAAARGVENNSGSGSGSVGDAKGKKTVDLSGENRSSVSPAAATAAAPGPRSKKRTDNEVGDIATHEKCPYGGFLGVEYALQQLLEIAEAADDALVEWERAVAEEKERANRCCYCC